MANSLEYWIEQFGIEKVQAAGMPNTIALAHYDSDPRASDTRITFRAKSGGKQSEGPRCYEVELAVELRMTKRDVAELDNFISIIENAFASPSSVAAIEHFAVLTLKDFETDAEREAKKDTRHRVRFFSFLATLNS